MIEVKDVMKHIFKTSSSIMDKCNMLMTQIDIVSESISKKNAVSSKVYHDHDPGLSIKLISDNQRQYLMIF